MVTSSEIQFTDILCELFSPEAPPMSPAAAAWALSVRLTDEQKERMLELADLSSRGEISDSERREWESFRDAGNFLTVLHAKARLSLMHEQRAN
jgi:predicted transcriptional regulator